jgi:hypothetical protein
MWSSLRRRVVYTKDGVDRAYFPFGMFVTTYTVTRRHYTEHRTLHFTALKTSNLKSYANCMDTRKVKEMGN